MRSLFVNNSWIWRSLDIIFITEIAFLLLQAVRYIKTYRYCFKCERSTTLGIVLIYKLQFASHVHLTVTSISFNREKYQSSCINPTTTYSVWMCVLLSWGVCLVNQRELSSVAKRGVALTAQIWWNGLLWKTLMAASWRLCSQKCHTNI